MYNLDCILQFLTAFILLVDTARCIFLPKNYEREKLPNWESAHEPLRVSLCFAIRSFGPVNSVDMTISSEIYMRTLWKDARLEGMSEFHQKKRIFHMYSDPKSEILLKILRFFHNQKIQRPATSTATTR